MSVVSIVRLQNDDVENAVRQVVELTENFESIAWKDATVLLKPNAVSPSKSGSGVVTDARVVEALTKLVKEKNPKRIVIGDGSSVGYDFLARFDSMRCMEVIGLVDVAKKLGVEIVDLNRDKQVEVEALDAFVMKTFAVAKTAWEADVIISVPVIKTHIRTGITCGLKNMKGVLPSDEKKRTHQLGLDRGIVDLNRVVKPTFTVVDGIIGTQGTHSDESDKVPLNLILASSDVVAVDAVCAYVAGFDVKDILHVQLAAEANLGIADLSQIEARGEDIEAVKRPFIPFLQAAQERFGGANIIEKNTCTGCMGEIISTFIYLSKAGFHHRLSDLTFIMGTPDEVPRLDGTAVVLGKCARKYRHLGVFVPGCPPHGIKITDGACEALRIDKGIVHRAISELHTV